MKWERRLSLRTDKTNDVWGYRFYLGVPKLKLYPNKWTQENDLIVSRSRYRVTSEKDSYNESQKDIPDPPGFRHTIIHTIINTLFVYYFNIDHLIIRTLKP